MKRIEVRHGGQVNQAVIDLLVEAGVDVVRLRPLIVDTDNRLSDLNVVLAAAKMLSDVSGVLVYPHRDVNAVFDLVAVD
ncbi:MAG: hypothetical protein Q8P31_02950 [Bacillota bacterium]|nr:hypothetical protein [Bacillota bacterium]